MKYLKTFGLAELGIFLISIIISPFRTVRIEVGFYGNLLALEIYFHILILCCGIIIGTSHFILKQFEKNGNKKDN